MTAFSEQELADIQQFFGHSPENLDTEAFKKTLRELRAKYHPDNFERFGDEVVRQLATERFQRIERLAEKIEAWKSGSLPAAAAAPSAPPPGPAADPLHHPRARFAYREMKIEIRTSDKDLKFHLFGTFYRWLLNGDRFKIPGSQAYIIADESHAGHRIGFVESIRLYLTFEENDLPETIVQWLFDKLAGHADTLFVEGERVPVERESMLWAIKKRSFRGLPAEGRS
jgi:hypothetical protein